MKRFTTSLCAVLIFVAISPSLAAAIALPSNAVPSSTDITVTGSNSGDGEAEFDFSTTGKAGSKYTITFDAAGAPVFSISAGAAITSMQYKKGKLKVQVQIVNQVGFSSPTFRFEFFEFGPNASESASLIKALRGTTISFNVPGGITTISPFKTNPLLNLTIQTTGKNKYQIWMLVPKTFAAAVKKLAGSKQNGILFTENGKKPANTKVTTTSSQTLYVHAFTGAATAGSHTFLVGSPDAFSFLVSPTVIFANLPITATLRAVSCPSAKFILSKLVSGHYQQIFSKKPKTCSVIQELTLTDPTTLKAQFSTHTILQKISALNN